MTIQINHNKVHGKRRGREQTLCGLVIYPECDKIVHKKITCKLCLMIIARKINNKNP